MNAKIILILLAISFLSKSTKAQNKCSYINFVLLIDGKIVMPDVVTDEYLLLTKDTKEHHKIDAVPFNYCVGTITFSDLNLKELFSLPDSTKILLTFKYRKFDEDREPIDYNYTEQMKIGWLKEPYVIFKVYNFENSTNRRLFDKKEGYGIEIETASFSTIIPRRKKR